MNLPPIKTDLPGWDRVSGQVIVTAVNQFDTETTGPAHYNHDTGCWELPTIHFPMCQAGEYNDWTVTTWADTP